MAKPAFLVMSWPVKTWAQPNGLRRYFAKCVCDVLGLSGLLHTGKTGSGSRSHKNNPRLTVDATLSTRCSLIASLVLLTNGIDNSFTLFMR